MKKIAGIIAIIAIAMIGTSFAITDTKSMPYPYYNMPDVLVFSGVAAKGDNVGTAVFIALDKTQVYDDIGPEHLLPYKTFYIIVDGKASQLKLKGAFLDKETQTLVASFTGDNEITLVIKQHTSNYQNVVVASGFMDGYLLNMKMYGNEYIYSIMPTTETKVAPVPTGRNTDAVVREAIAKIGK